MRLAFSIVLIVHLIVASPFAQSADETQPVTAPAPPATSLSPPESSVSQAAAAAIRATVASPTTSQIQKMEKDAFSHAFASDTDEQRICRLEHFVFGKQSVGNLSNRFAKLCRALASKEPPIDSPPATSSDSGLTTPTTASSPPPQPTLRHTSLIDIMNRGIDNYNLHRYQNAEDDFEECCAIAPGMSRCYSYLAITKMQLNLRQAAIDAFRTSNLLDPFGAYGRYARACLIVLAGDEAMRKRSPTDSQKVLDVAMSQIDKQSSENISRHRQEGNEIASSRLIYRPDFSYVDARVQSNSARTEGALRAAHTAESANNLKHMLAVKKMPGDANLRAWGTTLTTRYYGNETYLSAPYYIPRERPMELKAIVQSLQSSQRANKPGQASPANHHARASKAHVNAGPAHSHQAHSKTKRG